MAEENNAAERLEQLAYQQGRRDADVDAHLRALANTQASHEKRLSAINGSIERHALNAARLEKSIDRLRESVEGKAAVEADRDQQRLRAESQQVTHRTLWLAAGTVFVPLLGVIVALVTLILTSH